MLNSKNKIFLITLSVLFLIAIILFALFNSLNDDTYKKYKLLIIGINPILFSVFFAVLNYKEIVYLKIFVVNNDERKYKISSFGLIWIIAFCIFITFLQFVSFFISFKGVDFQIMTHKILIPILVILLSNFLCCTLFVKLNTYYLNKN
ncbi:hypothetical protein [Spiroplasma endosymbiont of Crioceris asparagi]|uniref:hypothetical protein n=1 Tax=Spiroplasma endosymbiont of Crioceris asparagi TaxID=3066286 RepID=UPI0030D49A2C